MPTTAIRDLLSNALAWQDAHATFDDVVRGFRRGARDAACRPAVFRLAARRASPHHTQRIFWTSASTPNYTKRNGRKTTGRPRRRRVAAAGNGAVRAFRRGSQVSSRRRLIHSISSEDPARQRPDLSRELVLVIDHSAYHVGQLVLCGGCSGVERVSLCGAVRCHGDSGVARASRRRQHLNDTRGSRRSRPDGRRRSRDRPAGIQPRRERHLIDRTARPR